MNHTSDPNLGKIHPAQVTADAVPSFSLPGNCCSAARCTGHVHDRSRQWRAVKCSPLIS
jgi:hypothetical protein